MLTVEVKGDFSKTKRFFKNALNNRILNSLDAYGRAGVVALSSATPVATGLTAQSWSYTIVAQNGPLVTLASLSGLRFPGCISAQESGHCSWPFSLS